MSETDDTDVLLLIPPDFFAVRSSASEESLLESSRTVVHKPSSCTAKVLGKLVDQVYTLEARLETLEINSTITDTSLTSLPRRKHWDTDSCNSQDRKSNTFPRRRKRKTKKLGHFESSLSSIDTLSLKKSVPPLKLRDYEVATIDSNSIEINESQSMDGDISSIVSTPNKKNDKLLLHEIDEFLTKVEAYESPETKYRVQESISPDNVIKATGDYISQKLEDINTDQVKLPSGRTVPSNILDKYIYLVKTSATPSTSSQADNACESPATSQTQPATDCRKPQPEYMRPVQTTNETQKTSQVKIMQDSKSPSIRRLNFTETKDVQPTSTPKRPTSTYANSFKPSTNKIYDRATKVLEQYKAQSYSRNTQNSIADSSYLTKEEFKMPQIRPYVPDKDCKLQSKLLDTIDTDLLSLSDLWGEKGDGNLKGDSIKLEEERLKREHCEALIQQLQKKLLDQQERLAVAVKVDRTKDAAIFKLREAWTRLTGSLDRAEERHRTALDKMMTEVDNFKVVADEAQKKTNHFESELYKALDLAHDYQEKCKQLANDVSKLREGAQRAVAAKDDVVAAKEKEIEVLKENYETVICLNKQSTDCVKSLEESLEKEKSEHNTTKNKVAELSRQLQSIRDQTLFVEQERDLLKEKVNEERARGNILENQLCEKQNQVSDLLRKCDSVDNEIKTLRKHLELQKNELKTHYQKQLEDAVLAKLQEFQHQLDIAEREMENDARGKETALMDSYGKQIARMEEQHKLEVNVLEEKHREEIKLYRLQLAQANEKTGLLENKVDSYRRRRGEIAHQLHGVMEAQWRQALTILTGPARTPATHDGHATHATHATHAYNVLDLSRADTGTPVGRARADLNVDGLSDVELQQYVKLLLTKPPSLPAVGCYGDAPCPPVDEPTSDRPQPDRRRGKPPWKA